MGSTDRHLYVTIDEFYGELQDENGELVQSWTQESIREWTRNLAELETPYEPNDHVRKTITRTRLAVDPCNRCNRGVKFFARRLIPTFEFIKLRFKDWNGAYTGLTVGMGFCPTIVWFDVLIIMQKPHILLSIRLEPVGLLRDHTIFGAVEEVIQYIQIWNNMSLILSFPNNASGGYFSRTIHYSI